MTTQGHIYDQYLLNMDMRMKYAGGIKLVLKGFNHPLLIQGKK